MDQAQLRRLFEALQVLTGDRGAAGKRALRVEEFEKLFGTADARTQKRLQEISASAEQQAGAISTILDDLIQLNQETSNIVQYVDQEVSGARNDAQQALTAATTALDTELAAARGEAAAALAEARAEIDTDITQARSDAAQAVATAQSEAAQALADARAALEGKDGEIEASVEAIAVTVGQNTAAISSEATTRATADQALSEQITTVSAGVASNTAAISEEAIARATADTSLAAQITTLTATVDTNTAEISAEQIARAAADTALATQISTLQVSVDGNAAAITSEATTRASADTFLAAQIDTLSVSVGANAAAITTEAAARATADTALSAQIDTLSATVGGNTAAISSEATTRANADSALSSQISTISAATADNAAAISAEQIARANADSALAANINTVSAANAANAAAITSEATTRANADTALAADITTLTASVGTNAAAIAAEATTRAAADSALATQINTLNTSVGANAAAISAESTARTTADTALAAQITALTSTVGENTASINEEALTRATADNTLAAQISTIQAEFFAPQVLFLDGPEGSLLSIADHLQEQSTIQKIVATVQAESVARASEDQALAAQITTVNAEFSSESISLVRDRFLALQNSANWSRDQGQGALNIVSNELFSFGQTWRFTTALGQQDGLFTRSDRATWRGVRNSNAFRVEIDFTLQSGTLAGAGVAVDWQNTASTVFRRAIALSDMLVGPAVIGQPARATAIFRRPTDFSGTFDFTTLRAWANNAAIGNGAKEIRFHRISIWPANADEALAAETAAAVTQEAIARANGDSALATQIGTVSSNVGSLTATVTQQATALTTLEGYAAATLAFRAQAGSGGATLELVASNNPSGPASAARIDAQNIILNGSVTATQLATENLITQTAQIANGIVTNAKIADATIQGAKIADATITSAKIENAAITSAKIGDAQITSAKIADTIQSTNFVSGPTGSGWRIQMNGDAEFGTLSLRQNAVSETRHELVTNPTITTAGTHPRAWVNVAQVNYTPFSADTTTLFMAEFQLEMVITTSNGFRNAVYDWELLWRNTVIASGQDNIFAERISIVNVTTEKTIDVQKFKISPGSTSGQLLLRMRFVEQSGTAPFFSFGVKYAEVASLEFKR